MKGDGKVKYEDIKKGNIKKIKQKRELNFKMPQNRFVENYNNALNTKFLSPFIRKGTSKKR